MNYDEYYLLCREEYLKANPSTDQNSLRNFYEETVSVRNTKSLPPEYETTVNEISLKIKEDFDNMTDCDDDGLMIKHNNIWKFSKEIKLLCNILAPSLERDKYSCHVYVDKIYIYRTATPKPDSSYLWHYDNNPHEIVKTLIYLTDVTEENSPFEYLQKQGAPGQGFLGLCTRKGTKTCYKPPNGSRVGSQVNALLQHGYEKNKVCGPKGTAISFLNNTYHRVNVLERGYRDVINIRVKPTLIPAPEYANEKWTTSFEHSGVVNMDPEKAWKSVV
tara:strand:+ start:5878 stop:6702 length:825 start_codon:yes stop_codon:yes gene_type:complete